MQPANILEYKENSSTEGLQSLVIENDIDLEEEMSKVQQGQEEFFKMLSISFYENPRSRSVEPRPSRDVGRISLSSHAMKKGIVYSKERPNIPSGIREESNSSYRLKVSHNWKEKVLLLKGLQLTPDDFHYHPISPQDAVMKRNATIKGEKKPMKPLDKDNNEEKEGISVISQQSRALITKKLINDRLKADHRVEQRPIMNSFFNGKLQDDIMRRPQHEDEVTFCEEYDVQKEMEAHDRKLVIERKTDRDSLEGIRETKFKRKKASRREENILKDRSPSSNNSGRSSSPWKSSSSKAKYKKGYEPRMYHFDQDPKPNSALLVSKKSTELKSVIDWAKKVNVQEENLRRNSDQKFLAEVYKYGDEKQRRASQLEIAYSSQPKIRRQSFKASQKQQTNVKPAEKIPIIMSSANWETAPPPTQGESRDQRDKLIRRRPEGRYEEVKENNRSLRLLSQTSDGRKTSREKIVKEKLESHLQRMEEGHKISPERMFYAQKPAAINYNMKKY